MKASKTGRVEICELLLNRGVDVDSEEVVIFIHIHIYIYIYIYIYIVYYDAQ
jgi:hypothetical protein